MTTRSARVALAERRCVYGDDRPTRFYVSGWKCAEHAPPLPPVPPAGTTAVELAEQAHARHLADTVAAKVAASDRERERRRRQGLAW